MAIKGDIDLTNNLDFRHDREDKIKELEESSKIVPWHSELNITPKYVADLTATYRATINNRNFIVDYDYDTDGNATTVRIIYSGQRITSHDIQDILDNTLISDSISESYYMNDSHDINSTLSYYNYDLNTTTWSNNWSYQKNLETEKEHAYPWKDPFKHRKNILEYHSKHDKLKIKTTCYECGREYLDIFNDTNFNTCPRCAFIRKFGDYNLLKHHTVLPWHNGENDDKNRNFMQSWGSWRRIRLFGHYNTPWIPKDEESEDDSKFTIEDIPWIKDMRNDRIRKDYIKDLYEEQDYSNYLTNMGWLGLRD